MKKRYISVLIVCSIIGIFSSCTDRATVPEELEYDVKEVYQYLNQSEYDIEIHAWGINWAGSREYFEHTWTLKSKESLEFKYHHTLTTYEGPDASLVHADSVKLVFPDKKELWYYRDGVKGNIMVPPIDYEAKKYIYTITQEHYERSK